MKFRKNKKGFTIVELIIVIAVIGILTAVMVPTIVHLVGKANKASDDALVSNLNKALALRESEKRAKPAHMHEAVEGLEEYGYKLDALVAKSDEDLLYNLKENKFLLTSDAVAAEKDNYWQIRDDANDKETYNIYASSKFAVADLTDLKVGFDAGYQENISSVEYTGTKDVKIRTNGGSLTIDAEQANVEHYGKSGKVLIKAVYSESYHELGEVENIEIKKGHVEVSNDAVVGAILVSGNNVTVDTLNDEVEVKVAEGVTGAEVTGVTPSTVKLVSTLSNLSEGDKVALDADLTSQVWINKNGVEVDLNGHSIKTSNYALIVDAAENVRFTGNGLIQSTGNVAIASQNGAQLTLDTLTVEAQEAAVMAFTNSAVTINSGKFIAHDNFVLGTNGSTGKGGNTFVINGGEFVGTIQSAGYIACGIYAANEDSWTINGGTFDITNGSGIVVRGGTVVVGEKVEINLANSGEISNGKVGDSRQRINANGFILVDRYSQYPAYQTIDVTNNNSKYSLVDANGSPCDSHGNPIQ